LSARGLLGLYRATFSLLLIIASVQTLAAEPAASHAGPLAATEILGALLLLARRTQTLALVLLLASFAGAQLLAARQGVWPTRFAHCAASVLLIVLLEGALAGTGARPRAARDSEARPR